MILYRNPDRSFSGEAYDQTYSQSPDRFGHAITFRALDQVFADHLTGDQAIRAFDLGCGQGQVISYVRQLLNDRSPAAAGQSRLFGIDISDVAIEQCEQRDPTINWIADSFQDFLQRDETAELRGTFDLVINKGGLTQVRSADEYRAMLQGIHDLLADGGLYLFVQYKQFYQVWSNEHCLNWDTDIFELAADVIGRPSVIDDDSAYICVHRKGEPKARLAQRKPRRIHFRMNDGSTQTVFVSGDELTDQRLRQLRSEPDRQQFIAFELSADANDRQQALHAERIRMARAAFVSGRPRVLLATGRVRMTEQKAVDPESAIVEALSSSVNVIAWPGMISTVRHLCRHAVQWSAVQPDHVIIGPGLEDYKIDSTTMQPIVDPDEFRYRLHWLLNVLTRGDNTRVAFIATPPVVEFTDDRNGYIYQPAAARQFMTVAADVCSANGAAFVDVSKKNRVAKRDDVLPAIAMQAAGLLDARQEAACTR